MLGSLAHIPARHTHHTAASGRPFCSKETSMEAGRVVPTGTGVGEPTMGQVYDPTATPAFAAKSFQVVALDPTGAQMSNNEGRKATYSGSTIAYTPYATPQDIVARATQANQLE